MYCIEKLHEKNLITEASKQEDFDTFFQSLEEEIYGLGSALEEMHWAGLLIGNHAKANRAAIVKHKNPGELALGLKELRKGGLLTGEGAQENFEAYVNYEPMYNFPWILKALYDAGLLTGDKAQHNRNLIANHQNPSDVGNAVRSLIDHRHRSFFTEDNKQSVFELLAEYQPPSDMVKALNLFSTLALSTVGEEAKAKLIAVAQSGYLDSIGGPLCLLANTGLLGREEEETGRQLNEETTARFHQVIQYSNILLGSNEINRLWNQIPFHRFGENNWRRIIQICRAGQVNVDMGRTHLLNYLNAELIYNPNVWEQQEQEGEANLNAGQSTHTASIHQTVSESARRLKSRYQEQLNQLGLSEILDELRTWVEAQPEHVIEKRCIAQLVSSRFDFKDPTSEVTTKELLAFFWLAIHDDDLRIGDLRDAEIRLLEGLYDIQRAYNLSDNFEDMGGADLQACASGTFNKLIEKLVTIHPDAEQEYITHKGAYYKLKALVLEQAANYLSAETNANALRTLTPTMLKEAIRIVVSERLFFEFGSLYIDTSQRDIFGELIRPYKTFEALKASEHYQAFQELLTHHHKKEFTDLIELRLTDKEPEHSIDLAPLIEERIEELKTAYNNSLLKEQIEEGRDKFSSTSNAKDEPPNDGSGAKKTI